MNILLFQKKIFFLSIFIALCLSYLEVGNMKHIGFYYLFIAPAVHFFAYEIINEQQYYYFFNLGLSKIYLWVSTVLISIINIVIASLI